MEANTVINALANAGGLGLLAGALFYLHLRSLKTFAVELEKERNQCHADHEKIMSAVSNLTKCIARLVVEARKRRPPT